MKTLDIKKIDISFEETGSKGTYKELINMVLNSPPGQNGFSFDDLKNRQRIEDALEKSNGKLELEDSDYENLKQYTNSTRWPFRHKDILKFCQDVNEV